MFQCHSSPRWMKPHKATPPTSTFDWQPRCGRESASLSGESGSSIQQTHKHRYFSVFYLNGVKHLHKWEASQYMYSTKKVIFFPKFSCKEKKNLDFIFQTVSVHSVRYVWDPNRSQKWGLAPDKIPTYFTHPPPEKQRTEQLNQTHPGPDPHCCQHTWNTPAAFFFFSLHLFKGSFRFIKTWVLFWWFSSSLLSVTFTSEIWKHGEAKRETSRTPQNQQPSQSSLLVTATPGSQHAKCSWLQEPFSSN